MPYRNSYLEGNPYPTGKSPLVLDIEKNIQAVGQQMVENKKREIAEKKLSISDNQRMILDALDMQPLEGMGHQVALEHSKKIEDLTNRWTEKWANQDGNLSMQDKMNLRKEQLNLEQKLKVAASDIATIAEIKKELYKGDNSIYELEPTMKALTEYQNKGLAGSGGAINIPVLKQEPFGAKAMAFSDPFMKRAAESSMQTVEVTDPKTGQVQYYKTNKSEVDKTAEEVFKQPVWQQLKMNDPQKYQQLTEMYKRSFYKTEGKPDFESAAKTQPGNDNYYLKKYGWGLTNKDQLDNIVYMNDYAERVKRLDPSAIDMMKTESISGIGVPADVSVNIESGKPVLTITGQGDKGKVLSIQYPEPTDEKAVKDFKLRILNLFSAMQGKQVPSNISKFIETNWDELKISEKPSYSKMTALDEMLKTGKVYYEENSSGYRQDIVDEIKSKFPDLKINTSSTYWGLGKGNIEITDKDNKSYKYDLGEEKDRQKLLDFINQKADEIMNKYFSKTETKEQEQQQFSDEQEKVIKEIMSKKEVSREKAIQAIQKALNK